MHEDFNVVHVDAHSVKSKEITYIDRGLGESSGCERGSENDGGTHVVCLVLKVVAVNVANGEVEYDDDVI